MSTAAAGRVAVRLHKLPLRARLIAIMTALLLLAIAVTAAATAYLMRRDLIGRVDANLRTNATRVAESAADQWNANHEEVRLPSGYVVVVFDATGKRWLEFRSTDLDELPSLVTLPLTDPRVASQEPFTLRSTTSDEKWRAIAGTTSDHLATFIVARPLTEVSKTVDHFVLFTAALGLAMTLACGLLGWYAMRRAFRPLHEIERTAAAIASGDLSSRIPTGEPAPTEVASLSASLNTMLADVEHSFAVREKSEERMRQFVADASHELRTPLATVRGYAELYRQGAVPPDAVGATMTRIESEASRMSNLVDDLLLLARLDEEREKEHALLDVTVVAAEEVQAARVRDPERRISLQGRGEALGPVMVEGTESDMHQLLGNLLTNAIRHTPAGTPIEVAVGTESERARAVLEVRDHGNGIDEATRAKVFERFFRADAARSRASGGTGLGLAIVAAIAARHGGRVGIAPTPGGGATFVVELPTAKSQDQLSTHGG